MAKIEKLALTFIAIMGVILVTHYYSETIATHHLDTVFLFESISGIWETGKPVSESVASWPLVAKTIVMLPEQVCAMDFGFPNPPLYNVYDNHAYVALYPLALVGKIVGVERAFSLANALAYLTLLLAPYVFLRSRGTTRFSAFIFSICVLCYPGWSISALGDYYLDRLYMPCMLVLLYVLHQQIKTPSPKKYFLLVPILLAIAAASFNERASIMVIAALLFFWVMFPSFRRNRKLMVATIGVLAVLIFHLVFYFSFFYHGIDGAHGAVSLSYSYLIGRMTNPAMMPFILTNFLFLGWFVFFAGWRYALLLLGALIPNILINIGGAELTGWMTHYHSMYIPFLIFTASVGFLHLNQCIKQPIFKLGFFAIIGASVLTFACFFDPATARWSKELPGSFGVTSSVFKFYAKPQSSTEIAATYWLKLLEDEIPAGVKISSTEGVMPVLYKSRRLALYPYGIDEAEYIIVAGSVVNGVPTGITGAPNDLDSPLLNACLAKRAKDQGFVFFKDFSPVGVIVFKRIKN